MADDEQKPEQKNEQPTETAPEECQPENNPDVEDPRLFSPLIQSDNPALKERSVEEPSQPEAAEHNGDADDPPGSARQPGEAD